MSELKCPKCSWPNCTQAVSQLGPGCQSYCNTSSFCLSRLLFSIVFLLFLLYFQFDYCIIAGVQRCHDNKTMLTSNDAISSICWTRLFLRLCASRIAVSIAMRRPARPGQARVGPAVYNATAQVVQSVSTINSRLTNPAARLALRLVDTPIGQRKNVENIKVCPGDWF